MYAITIYNNKGGVGKSTLTVFMADFLASLVIRERSLRVVVLDLDPQGSCGVAMLGREGLEAARQSGLTVGDLARRLDAGQKVDIGSYLHRRAAGLVKGRATAIGEVAVMVSDKASGFAFEVNPLHRLTTFREKLRPFLATCCDIVLMDLPGNIDVRNLLAVNGLIMSDSVIVPVEVSRFSLEALPDTLEMIHYARERGGGMRPTCLGLLLNRVDKRGQQYHRNIGQVHVLADRLGIPVFENALPNAQSLTTATDDTGQVGSLRDRYGHYHAQVKAVVIEAFRRWHSVDG
ncbi:MAG: ParA family protein [Magnetococcales bacterium]|nr:ParA family protein [Magnetococcales bacterium]